MISISKISEATIKNAKRVLKVLQYGAKTADECAPFGDDSAPLKGMTAIFAKTEESGDSFIIGYINKNQISTPGEKRIFSLNNDGSVSTFIHLRQNGIMEIGGSSDNLVRFSPLDLGLQNQNQLINTELQKIALSISGLGGVYTPATVSTNISGSKINEIKTL